jgi:hypothetical protein
MLVLGALAAVCSLSAGSAKATVFNLVTGGSVPLSTLLISGNSAVVGDLSFVFDPGFFSSTSTGGSLAPTAAQISVAAFNFPPVSPVGEPGIQFQATWNASNGGTIDTKIGFTVTTLDGSKITDDYLATTGNATTSSEWTVGEQVTNFVGASLLNQDVSLTGQPVTTTLSALGTFAPQSALIVHKDISLTSDSANSGTAFISDVSQGFSVPVPAAALSGMSVLGGLGLLGAFRKARRA